MAFRIWLDATDIGIRLRGQRRNFFSLRRTARILGISTQPVRDWIRLGYDGHTLFVQFHTSDTIYCHPGEHYLVFEALWRAEEHDEERVMRQAKDRACAPIWAAMRRGPLAQLLGGGEAAEGIADFLTRIQYDLPVSSPTPAAQPDQSTSGPVKPSPSESNPVKPVEESHGP